MKESHVTILLVSIVLISMISKRNEILIQDNYISIIDDNEIPVYSSPKTLNVDSIINQNIQVDTTRHTVSKKDPNFGKEWMQRYKSGIRFEFYPP